jgi:hypothetical protein
MYLLRSFKGLVFKQQRIEQQRDRTSCSSNLSLAKMHVVEPHLSVGYINSKISHSLPIFAISFCIHLLYISADNIQRLAGQI